MMLVMLGIRAPLCKQYTPISRLLKLVAVRRRVLWNDPASGVMRHADTGYVETLDCAREHQLTLPGICRSNLPNVALPFLLHRKEQRND